jgi:vacuolar protein sorting-associated protein 13A/C
MNLSQSIPRVLVGAPEGKAQAEHVSSAQSSSSSSPDPETPKLVDLEPELRMISSADGSRSWTTIDMVVTVDAVKLHLYDSSATIESNLKGHGIARFALNQNTLRLKMLSDGAGEAQVILKSFTMSNTRPGSSKFREIIPAGQHDRNQFMLLYTMSGGPNGSALAILTVDSPQVIFAIDPVFALLKFFTSAFPDNAQTLATDEYVVQSDQHSSTAQKPALDFRVDLHDVSICVLENDADPGSQAIKLTINQVLLSQQVQFLSSFRYVKFKASIGDHGVNYQPSWNVPDTHGKDGRGRSFLGRCRLDILSG